MGGEREREREKEKDKEKEKEKERGGERERERERERRWEGGCKSATLDRGGVPARRLRLPNCQSQGLTASLTAKTCGACGVE